MTCRFLPVMVFTFVAALTVNGCVTVAPAPKQARVEMVDSGGVLDSAARAEFIDKMTRWSDTEVVGAMFDDIATLSHAPLYMDNKVDLLVDGPQTYERMTKAIESAQHYVLLESYIFADDKVGTKFAELLARRSREGVVVKVIYDSFGSGGSSNGFFEDMEASGVSVLEFNAVNPLKGETPLDFNYRDHRKILVVDGRVAFTGGINLAQTYSTPSSQPDPEDLKSSGWRDTHIAIRGPAVAAFEQLFLESWRKMGGKTTPVLGNADRYDGDGAEVVAILSSQGGDDIQSEIFEAYLHAMRVAQKKIWITQAYFVPGERFMTHLVEAAGRGVDVRVLVPGVSDSSLVLNASRSRYGELLEAGVRIYERENALLHAKTAVIDGLWSTVGSSNLDYRSFVHNDEVNAVILGRQFALEMEGLFQMDLEASREIVLADWRSRSLWKRFKEKLSWFAEYWI